jgi:multidrug efflux pump subunit AcrA (membrane-fusion protein)
VILSAFPSANHTVALLALSLAGCNATQNVQAGSNPGANPVGEVTVGVVSVTSKPLARSLTISSELVPFQESDVYAKESGYVKQLLVDYGSRVKEGQLMGVLEIPELELQLMQDDAAIKSAADQVSHAEHEVTRMEAQHKVYQLQFDRLDKVAKSQPGLVAQQEVDDAQGKDLSSEAHVSIPILNGHLFAARREAANDRARESDQRLRDEQLRLSRDVRVAWADASTAWQRIEVTVQLIQQANLALNLAQGRYNLGLASIVELSQAQLNQTEAEIENLSAKYDYQMQYQTLQHAVGQLR